jgi:hypothetical protein
VIDVRRQRQESTAREHLAPGTGGKARQGPPQQGPGHAKVLPEKLRLRHFEVRLDTWYVLARITINYMTITIFTDESIFLKKILVNVVVSVLAMEQV